MSPRRWRRSAEAAGRRTIHRQTRGNNMLFMIIERFKDQDAVPVYKRFRESGRMAPEGLKYVGSWIEANFDRCFQLMECDDLRLIQQWALNWRGRGGRLALVAGVA